MLNGAFSFFLLGLVCLAPLHADELDQYNGKFRIAKEVELKVSRLQYLTRFYHFIKPVGFTLPPSLLNAYLDDPANLAKLSPPVFAKLVEGVEADLSEANVKLPTSAAILGPDGKPFGGVEVFSAIPPKADVTQPVKKPALVQSTDFADLKYSRTELAWKKVRDRWAALSSNEKLSEIDPNNLPPLLKAELYRTERLEMSAVRPGLYASKVLEGMELEPIVGATEMRDLDDRNYSSPRAYLNDLTTFGKAAGISNYLRDPIGHHDGEASLHTHISTVEPRDLTTFLVELNRLYLLRFIEAGEAEAVLEGDYRYSPTLSMRGLLRQVSNNHFEIRTHLADPETELKEVLRWLSMPEEAALAEMRAEQVSLLDKESATVLRNSVAGIMVGYHMMIEAKSRGVDLSKTRALRGVDERIVEVFIEKGAFNEVITLRSLYLRNVTSPHNPVDWRRFRSAFLSKINPEVVVRMLGDYHVAPFVSELEQLFLSGDAAADPQRKNLLTEEVVDALVARARNGPRVFYEIERLLARVEENGATGSFELSRRILVKSVSALAEDPKAIDKLWFEARLYDQEKWVLEVLERLQRTGLPLPLDPIARKNTRALCANVENAAGSP